MLRRSIVNGVDYVSGRRRLPRHQHAEAYATIVLAGVYEQRAYAGRLRIEAGDVVIQPTFDCHNDHIYSEGVELVRLPWARDTTVGGVHRGVAIDDIVRECRLDVQSGASALAQALQGNRPLPPVMTNWADALAAALREDPTLRIGRWADTAGVSREYVTRCFGAAYGVTPARFRVEIRARAAWLKLTSCNAPLSAIAWDHGFADQSHMARAIKWLTGEPPNRWRKGSPVFETKALREPLAWH
jgi:AraC-like DNA-binding protein